MILQGQGCSFLEEWYSYPFPIVKNIFSGIDVEDNWQTQTMTKTYKLVTNNYDEVDAKTDNIF